MLELEEQNLNFSGNFKSWAVGVDNNYFGENKLAK